MSLEIEDINSIIIIQILKNMVPKIAVIGIIFLFLANSFFWNFYTGALFNFSMKIGGILSGQNFDIKNLPNYLTKLFDVPFSIMVQGIKMMFNIQGVVNNIMPLILLFSGILFLYFIFKAAVEIMSILIDYLVIGCFSMCIIIFSVLQITKNIGTGVIGAVIYAMTNVIVMFLLAGISFSLTDKIEKSGISSISKLFELILTLYIAVLLLTKIREIGKSIYSGKVFGLKGTEIFGESKMPFNKIKKFII